MSRIDEIRERVEKATPGPWVSGLSGHANVVTYDGDDVRPVGAVPGAANARFVIHAREDVPYLLAEVEMLRTEMSAVGAVCNENQAEVERLREALRCLLRRHQAACIRSDIGLTHDDEVVCAEARAALAPHEEEEGVDIQARAEFLKPAVLDGDMDAVRERVELLREHREDDEGRHHE